MRILGIETSCDETGAALVENGSKIISNVIASSINIHATTGGIIPESAARKQVEYILPVINEALFNGLNYRPNTNPPDIDAIAVTYGPGLIGSLLVGVEVAKTLSFLWKKPLIPVNHLIAHIFANYLENSESINLPAISLIVSGGHTELVLLDKNKTLKRIGGTRDDAAGEAFDKTARLLTLPYPGGPSIASKASTYREAHSEVIDADLKMFPRPMIDSPDFDFSFSGLKTSVLNKVKSMKNVNDNVGMLSAEIQEAIVDCLVDKSIKALDYYHINTFLLGGGVAANEHLVARFKKTLAKKRIDFFVPLPKFCTDNAAAIAACAYHFQNVVSWKNVIADPELDVV
ncbi:tRNA (adenosine(37)-N6)-threonylcarbamoyltransferase complex transferase subunit TsaD [Candidatus Woesebacteria bacterium]|nr:MAG: tRNA (adenosine(37)-N6)-threonylcarbamoyltransferase complex transferase subunit TsaD [Candidatus Woesebacteria bacterium]